MKRLSPLVAALSLAFAATPLRAAADISVMTQNQYLGADLAPLLTASDPGTFNDASPRTIFRPGCSGWPGKSHVAGRISSASRRSGRSSASIWRLPRLVAAAMTHPSRALSMTI